MVKIGTNGSNGVGLDFTWDGTRLGVKRENIADYSYQDLKGQAGVNGQNGVTPVKGTDYFTTEEIEAIKTSVKNQITASLYPVGSIYMSVSNTNPSNFFGGTWVAWGNGKVPVGVNTSDSSFNTVEKTGGAKTVNLSHSHTVNSHSHTMAHTHNYGVGLATYYGASTAEGGIYLYDNGSWVLKSTSNLGARNVSINNGFAAGMTSKSLGTAGATASTSGSSAANTGTSSPGTDSKLSDATSILQPYITCYMWKRTA